MQIVIFRYSPYDLHCWGAQMPAVGRQSQSSFQCQPGLKKLEFGVWYEDEFGYLGKGLINTVRRAPLQGLARELAALFRRYRIPLAQLRTLEAGRYSRALRDALRE